MSKDWNAIARTLSSPESSDAEDGPNVEMFKKNASRVAELLHSFVPGLDDELAGATPKGMNRPEAWRAELVSAFRASGTAHARPHARPSTAPESQPTAPTDPMSSRPASATPHAADRDEKEETEQRENDTSEAK